MKRFRPYCAGYIVLYVLSLLSLADVSYTLYCTVKGVQPSPLNFSFFAYIVFAFALCYLWMYGRSQVAIDGQRVRVAFPINRRPREGESRAMFIYRQGETDTRFVDKTFRLDAITRYGYVEDLGYERIDEGGAGENNKLFPVHEVAFITRDNKRYHLNAGIYSKKQRREMFALIEKGSGVKPEGKLGEELGIRNEEWGVRN